MQTWIQKVSHNADPDPITIWIRIQFSYSDPNECLLYNAGNRLGQIQNYNKSRTSCWYQYTC